MFQAYYNKMTLSCKKNLKSEELLQNPVPISDIHFRGSLRKLRKFTLPMRLGSFSESLAPKGLHRVARGRQRATLGRIGPQISF
jgi:hypothetical protein